MPASSPEGVSLPDGYELRSAHENDLENVVRLIDTTDRTLDLPLERVREFLTWIWHIPATDLERDTRVCLRSDVIVAYAQATGRPQEGGPLEVLIRALPQHGGNGIEDRLYSWAEALARERGTEGVRAELVDLDDPGHALLKARGYQQVRSSFTMWKELTADEAPGETPAGVVIRRYEDADERALFEVNERSFSDHWGFRPTSFEHFNEELHGEDWDPTLVFLAEADGDVVGHAVSLQFKDDGYIAILGVVKPWRGRGIGTALLRRSFAELAGRDLPEVRLGVDAQNPHGAVALYEGVGMTIHRRYDLFDLGTAEALSTRRGGSSGDWVN